MKGESLNTAAQHASQYATSGFDWLISHMEGNRHSIEKTNALLFN